MKKSFIIIEVLIAIFIIFLTIIILSSTYKQKLRFDEKSLIYQNLYINVKNIINLLEKEDINISSKNYVLYKKLDINNMKIYIFIKLLRKKTNYKVNIKINNNYFSNNVSNKVYFLYKIKLKIDYKNYIKYYTFNLVKVQKK